MNQQNTSETIEQRIHGMLDNAVENGYDVRDWSADDIVADLLAFADLMDEESFGDVLKPHVITWKLKRSVLQ